MKKFYATTGFLTIFMFFSLFAVNLRAQRSETYTGTVLSYGSGFNTRTVTRTFTLNIDRLTSDAQAKRYLNLLSERDRTECSTRLTTRNSADFQSARTSAFRLTSSEKASSTVSGGFSLFSSAGRSLPSCAAVIVRSIIRSA